MPQLRYFVCFQFCDMKLLFLLQVFGGGEVVSIIIPPWEYCVWRRHLNKTFGNVWYKASNCEGELSNVYVKQKTQERQKATVLES